MVNRLRGALNRWTLLAALVVFVAVALRVHNSIAYPVPRGYDSFGHVMYIWYLLKTGRIPLANEGWSFFHPPLFFAIAAAMWRVLRHVDPIRVMHLISLVFSLLGLVPAWISYLIVRRYFGARPLLLLLAPTFVLFLPVCIYTAPMIGNEGLHAVLCAVIVYCLLRTLDEWSLAWASALGTSLGLALLTKFTATGMVLSATMVILAVGWHRHQWRRPIRVLAVALSIAVVISGWFYVRNAVVFRNPFQMSRDFFFVQRIENAQARGARVLGDYFSFDRSIFEIPSMFPAGRPAIRSVWTGVFANTWFDAFGGWFTPGANRHLLVRKWGQRILALAVVPTMLVLIGLGTALWRLARQGWDDTLVAMLVVFGVIIGMYVQFTRSVAIYSALKASYLLPVTVVFSFWLTLGLSAVSRWPRLRAVLTAEMVLLITAIIPVFWYGRLFELPIGAQDQNARGVICYLADFHDRARELFQIAAAEGVYLGHENLATLAVEDDDPYHALAHIIRAEQLMPSQVIGRPVDRGRHVRTVRAEYRNTRAYIYDRLGWYDLALAAARDAVALDGSLAEAYYNQAVLLLKQGMPDQAADVLPAALEFEPNLVEARALDGVLNPTRVDCAAAVPVIEAALSNARLRRHFPVETGWGDITDAGIARHKIIPDLLTNDRPLYTLSLCQSASGQRLPAMERSGASAIGVADASDLMHGADESAADVDVSSPESAMGSVQEEAPPE